MDRLLNVAHDREYAVLTNVMQVSGPITGVSDIGQRLSEARTEIGISQAELARRAGVSAGTIGNLEAGTRDNPRELLAIAREVSVMPEWLKSGKGPKRPDGWRQPQHAIAGAGSPLAQSMSHPHSETEPSATTARVPLRGAIRMTTSEGRFVETEISADGGWVENWSDDPEAYAFRIHGNGLAPAVPDGYFIVMEPSIDCVPNDRVLIALHDGTRLVRQLASKTASGITVLSLLGGSLENFELSAVAWMHPFDLVRPAKFLRVASGEWRQSRIIDDKRAGQSADDPEKAHRR